MLQTPQRILIDTNIIINLEDNKSIEAQYSELNRICAQYGIQVLIHASSYDDVKRDKDEARKAISLSKLKKYHSIPKTQMTKSQKEALFGEIKKPNDDVDTDLLVSLNTGVVDILVTDDRGILSRVSNNDNLKERVLYPQDTISLLNTLLGSIPVNYEHVQDRICTEFPPDLPFFDSLKQDYSGFEDWYKKNMASGRSCWVVEQEIGLAGLIIYKDESRDDPRDAEDFNKYGIFGDNVLKICLFKVDPDTRGEKFGEQLLKKAMDFAFRNSYDSTYLTVFPKHESLIGLIEKFGFMHVGAKDNGEYVYCKKTKVTEHPQGVMPFEFHKLYWPCIKIGDSDKYFIPIVPEYHKRLFPEAAQNFTFQFELGLLEVSKTPTYSL